LPNTYINKCKKYENNHELAHLEENYFKYPAKQYTEKTENININNMLQNLFINSLN